MNIYIGIITQNQKNNIEELTRVAKYFDGIAAVDHFSHDGTYEILKERCGNGFVEQIPYYGHHGHSMSHFLFNPKIKIGNWIILADSSERIADTFAANIKPFVKMLENNKISTVFNYSKTFMFKVFPGQFVANTPHYSVQGLRPNFASIEKTNWFSTEKDYFYSLRKQQRNQYEFILHYLKYYLQNHSNHNLLGAEHFGNPQEVFWQKEQIRLQFLLYLQELNINNDTDSLINYWKDNPITPEMMWFINNVRILNDSYRYFILNDTENLVDDITRPCKLIS